MKPPPPWTEDQKRRAKPWLVLFLCAISLSTLAAALSMIYLGTATRPNLAIAGGIIVGGIALPRIASGYAKRKLDRIENP